MAEPVQSESQKELDNLLKGGQILTFGIDSGQFGLDVRKTIEILAMVPVTTVPGTPPFVLGIVNLKGKIVPVLSLRKVLGYPEVNATDKTCIIVVSTTINKERRLLGLVADYVSDVVSLSGSEIVYPSSSGGPKKSKGIFCFLELDEEVHAILDLDALIQEGSRDGFVLEKELYKGAECSPIESGIVDQ